MKSSPQFIAALFQLHRERGGGWIPRYEIEARAALMLPPLPPLPKLPPLPLPPLPRLV